MAQAAIIAVNEFTRLLRAETGLPGAVAELLQQGTDISEIRPEEITAGFATAELLEKATSFRYPAIFVYCERVSNKLTEKFRTFSGTAELVAEVRVTHEHVEELQNQLNAYVQAVTNVLDRNRGTWAPGIFHAGTYEITFQAVKRGGKNFIQSARVRVEANVSVD